MGIAITPLEGFSDSREPGYDIAQNHRHNLRLTTFGLGLVVTLNPTAMAGGHHQKGQLIAVPVVGVATQPAQMSYVQPVQMTMSSPPR